MNCFLLVITNQESIQDFPFLDRSYFVSFEGYTKEKTQLMTIANSVIKHMHACKAIVFLSVWLVKMTMNYMLWHFTLSPVIFMFLLGM